LLQKKTLVLFREKELVGSGASIFFYGKEVVLLHHKNGDECSEYISLKLPKVVICLPNKTDDKKWSIF
jgi:hypothetical protein